MDRRRFIQGSSAIGLAMSAQGQAPRQNAATAPGKVFWPDGARMVIAISLQMEAGAQPDRGAPSPWGALDVKYPDLPGDKWYEYGIKEGIPRLLDVYDRRKIKVTAHMVGQSVEKHPALAKEIVERGHEAAAHGQTWGPFYTLSLEEEKVYHETALKIVEQATGVRPIGFNAPGMHATANTFGILQDLGFLYHTDDLSRDEPFIVPVRKKPFVVVPYAFQSNDYQSYENRWHVCSEFANDLKMEFDALYAESGRKRRMMTITCHDRVNGRPARAKVMEEFIAYAQSHPGTVFMRKDDIAKFALTSPLTPRDGDFS
jgi:peptidoglycan/xylan/chitin deacetylase (PgdA/CDA1 family)